MTQEGKCARCGTELTPSPRNHPVVLQVLFGASFVLFLALFEKIQTVPVALWSWTAAQTLLGFLLARARLRLRRPSFDCKNCNP